MTLLSMACIFKPNDGLENYLKKKKIFFFFFLYFHIREILFHSRESGSISRRFPADPGGFTCMDRKS